MDKLQVFEHNGRLVTDSRSVAEVVDKQHKPLMRDIRWYIDILEKSGVPEIQPSNFFIPSTYVDSKGEIRPCYLCTKNGCNVIANEMTGTKGMLFTVAYVTQFEELADQLQTAEFLREYRLIARDGGISLAKAMRFAVQYLQAKGEPFPNDFADMLMEKEQAQMDAHSSISESDFDSNDGGDW